MDLHQIQLIVERYFALKINVKSRRRHLVDARKMYFGLCRDFTKHGLAVLGNSLKRDHATALHNIRSCKDLRQTDPDFNRNYIDLYRQVSDLQSKGWEKPLLLIVPKVIHPGRFRKLGYVKTKSIRKVFNQRGQTSK